MIAVFADSWTVAAEVTDRLARSGYALDVLSPADPLEPAGLPWADATSVIVAPRLADQVELVLDKLTRIGLHTTAQVPVFVLTTLPTRTARELGRYNGYGFRVIESPIMSGGPAGARTGTLSMAAAGPTSPADLAFLQETMAAHVVEMAAYGEPATVKLLSNALMSIHARVLADALVLAHDEGIDAQQFRRVLLEAAGASRAAERFVSLDAGLLEKDARLAESSFSSLVGSDTLFARLIHEIQGLEADLDMARRLLQPPTASL